MSARNQLAALNNMIDTKEKELARITTQKKRELAPLTKKRDELVKRLYSIMKTKGLTHYQGVRIEDVEPAPERVKKEKMPREHQLAKLRQMGIRNPEAALKEIGL